MLRRKFNKYSTANNKTKYENSCKLLQTKINSAKDIYESTSITLFTNFNKSIIYKYIRSLSKLDSIPPTLRYITLLSTSANTDSEKANTFNNYFYSVLVQPSSYPLPFSDTTTDLVGITITEEDVYNALTDLDITKATAYSSNCFIKMCISTLSTLTSLVLPNSKIRLPSYKL